MSLSTSDAFALPVLIINPACLSDTIASPTLAPLSPHSSISLYA